MLKYIVSLLILINIGTYAFSTPYIELFKNYIPEALHEDASYLNGVEESLQYYVKLHPDLIYYYLSYLNEKFVEKNNNPKTNYLNDLNNAKKSFLKKRSNWAEDQIQGIYSKITSRLKRDKMSSVFEDLVEDIEIDLESIFVEEDIALKEYFIYLYLTSDTAESFDGLKNYNALNDSILISKVITYNNKFKNLNSVPGDELVAALQDIKRYWYAFEPDFLSKSGVNLEFEVFEISIYAYNSYFDNPNNLVLSTNVFVLNYDFTAFDGTFHFSDYPLPTFIEPIRYDFPVKVVVKPIFSIGIGYKLALSDKIGFLSSIKGIVSYIYFSEQIEKSSLNNVFYTFTYNVVSGSEKFNYVYEVSDLKNYKNWIMSFKLELPVFHFNKMFYFDAGILVDYQSISFDFEVTKFDVRVFNNEEEIIGKETITTYNHNENKLTFSPLLTFNSRFSDLINLQFVASYRTGTPLAAIGLELFF
jgi:hypothetical protein